MTSTKKRNVATCPDVQNENGRGSRFILPLACARRGPLNPMSSSLNLPVDDITATDHDFHYTVHDHHDLLQQDVVPQQSPDVPIWTPYRRWRRCDRPRKNDLWTDDDLKRAMAAVNYGMNIHKASKTIHIPYSSLREWCYGQRTSRKRGNKDVSTPEEEQLLVDWLLQMCEMGLGLSLIALKLKVYEITKEWYS